VEHYGEGLGYGQYYLEYLLCEEEEEDGAGADQHGLRVCERQVRVDVHNSLQIGMIRRIEKGRAPTW
jgi:hypothetical protein